MKPPCDEAVIGSGFATAPCEEAAETWILAATILGSGMAFVDSTVVNVALPAIQMSLGGTVTNMQWVVEAYGLLLSALILTGGALGDVFGRKRMFLFGVTVFAVASVACALAVNIRELVIARTVQGFGAAFLVPGSLSIISSSFPERRRGRAIGTWSGFTSITAAAGPVVGGWLIEKASWCWAFFLNVPLALAVIVLSFWRVPESKAETKGHVDGVGALLATAGLTGVTYGFIESSSRGWTEASVWSGLVLGGACLIAFAYFEARTSFPMVPFGLFRSSDFSGANLVTLFLYSALGLLFSVPTRSDSGPALFGNSDWRCRPPVHTTDVSAFALVRRPRCSVWGQTPAHRRPAHRCRGISLFCVSISRRQLLDDVFPRVYSARPRNGYERRATDHSRNGYGRPESCGDCFRHQ